MNTNLPFLHALARDWDISMTPGRGARIMETWYMPDRETLEAFLERSGQPGCL